MASYCSKCGRQLDDGTRYCSGCGFDTMSQGNSNNQGGGYDQNYNQNNQKPHSDFSTGGMGGTLTIIFVLGVVWAIAAIISAILMIAFAGLFPFFIGPLSIIGGIIYIVSGLFAVLSCICIYKLEDHKNACTYCLIGSIFALLGSILGGIIGLVFYFLLKKEGYRFKS